jgi:hypothetical protein
MPNIGFYGIDDGHSNLKAINGSELKATHRWSFVNINVKMMPETTIPGKLIWQQQLKS